MDRATEELEKSGIAKSCLKEGDTAPEFILSNSSGDLISLSDILKKGPVVLSFYRGGW
jgi:peroxiredoxin